MRRFLESLTRSLGLLLIAGATPAALMAQQSTPAGWTPELAMKVKSIAAVRVSRMPKGCDTVAGSETLRRVNTCEIGG